MSIRYLFSILLLYPFALTANREQRNLARPEFAIATSIIDDNTETRYSHHLYYRLTQNGRFFKQYKDFYVDGNAPDHFTYHTDGPTRSILQTEYTVQSRMHAFDLAERTATITYNLSMLLTITRRSALHAQSRMGVVQEFSLKTSGRVEVQADPQTSFIRNIPAMPYEGIGTDPITLMISVHAFNMPPTNLQ